MMTFEDKDLKFVFDYLSERLEMSVAGELALVEVTHGVESLPAGRAFTDAERELLMLGVLYGARHLVQMQLQDADVNSAVRRGVALLTRREE